jgi:hypothetical protein
MHDAITELKQLSSNGYLSTMKERYMGEWRYISMYSYSKNQTEVNGNLYAWAALFPGRVQLVLSE